MTGRLTTAVLLILLLSCVRSGKDEFIAEHRQWQENRIERLVSPAGWLNLAGLYWLEEGINTVGSDPGNSIIFPAQAPAFIGSLYLRDGKIRFIPAGDTDVIHAGSPPDTMDLLTDKSGNPSILENGSLAWFIIDRSPRFGIRLRDYKHPALKDFHGIDSYPPSLEWKINAEYVPLEEPREILIPTVIGTVEKNLSPGILRFIINGKEHELLPTKSGNGLFIIMADGTSGMETYGGGRFLYTDLPDRKNRVVIDFNRAYNPPCAFTPYATCPLPPKENFLDIPVKAGEKFTGH